MTSIGLAPTAKQVRQDKIVESLRRRPKTIEELATNIDCSYYTVRKDIEELRALFRVMPNGAIKNRSTVWTVGAKSLVPQLYNVIEGRYRDTVEFVEAWVRADFPDSGSVNAARSFMPLLLEWLGLLARVKNNEPVQADELDRVHAVFEQAAMSVAAMNAFYEQFLSSKAWSFDDMRRIAQSPDVDIERIIVWLRAYQEKQNKTPTA